MTARLPRKFDALLRCSENTRGHRPRLQLTEYRLNRNSFTSGVLNLERAEHSFGAREARRERNGSDPVWFQFACEAPDHASDPVLGQIVEATEVFVMIPGDGAHDEPALAGQHQRD